MIIAERIRAWQLLSRRTFLAAAAALPNALAGSSSSRIVRSVDPQIEEFDFASIHTVLTPDDEFFVRSHFTAPRLSFSKWNLAVTGHVRSPFLIGFSDLSKRPSSTITATLECAGNGVGAGGVSTATWTGIPLSTLLRIAGLRSGAKYVRLVGRDHGLARGATVPIAFERSIPLSKALMENTLIAHQMNGTQLTVERGYPARAIIPGWYAMDSVKWLVTIDVLDHEDTSYFMSRQYVANRLQAVGSEQYVVTRMLVKSQIARPREGEILSRGMYTVHGAAWSGESGVASVEISTDGGGHWQRAALQQAADPYRWTLWEYGWDIQAPGPYTVVARATDQHGRTQPALRDESRLDTYELNSYHEVQCRVI